MGQMTGSSHGTDPTSLVGADAAAIEDFDQEHILKVELRHEDRCSYHRFKLIGPDGRFSTKKLSVGLTALKDPKNISAHVKEIERVLGEQGIRVKRHYSVKKYLPDDLTPMIPSDSGETTAKSEPLTKSPAEAPIPPVAQRWDEKLKSVREKLKNLRSKIR
jgi:hypothetical protein